MDRLCEYEGAFLCTDNSINVEHITFDYTDKSTWKYKLLRGQKNPRKGTVTSTPSTPTEFETVGVTDLFCYETFEDKKPGAGLTVDTTFETPKIEIFQPTKKRKSFFPEVLISPMTYKKLQTDLDVDLDTIFDAHDTEGMKICDSNNGLKLELDKNRFMGFDFGDFVSNSPFDEIEFTQ